MKTFQRLYILFLIAVLSGCSASSDAVDLDTLPERIDSNGMLAVAQMATARAAHTATLLPNGTVLIAGGFADGEQALSSMEIYRPETDSFELTTPLAEARQSHTATLLPRGKVLLAGGFNGNYLNSAELYDPETGRNSSAGTMTAARSGHVAVLLNDGKVLLAGEQAKDGRFWFLRNSTILIQACSAQSVTCRWPVSRIPPLYFRTAMYWLPEDTRADERTW